MIHQKIRETNKCIDSLQEALLLECSEQDAIGYGTHKEWKEIERQTNKLRTMNRKISNAVNGRSDSLLDNLFYTFTDKDIKWLVLLFGIGYVLVSFGLVCAAVYLFTVVFKMEFTMTKAVVIWLMVLMVQKIIGEIKS